MHMKAEVVPATAREAQLVNMACLDQNRSCAQWAKLGECKTNAQWMSKTCRKSCGKCAAGACGDFNGDCEAWAKAGECESNKIYMHSNCAGSCGTCNKGHGTDHIPVITLNGPAQLFLGVATFSTYTDPGAKCADANFAHKVRIIGDAVHLYNPGTYEVKFECENATSVSRIVHVISDLGVGSALIKNSNNAEFEKLLSDVLASAEKTKKTDLGQVDDRFWKPFYVAMNLKYHKQTAASSGAVAVAHQSHTHAPVITTTADTSACKQRDKNKLCGYVPASPGSVFLYAKSYVYHFFVLGIGPLRGSAKASKNGEMKLTCWGAGFFLTLTCSVQIHEALLQKELQSWLLRRARSAGSSEKDGKKANACASLGKCGSLCSERVRGGRMIPMIGWKKVPRWMEGLFLTWSPRCPSGS
jgi:hypothetical protein